jgi:hypothetical protein
METAVGGRAASPTPTSARHTASVPKLEAVPVRAVATLHTARPPAMIRGRGHRSAAAPRKTVVRPNTTTNTGPISKPMSARESPSSAISTGASEATSWRST